MNNTAENRPSRLAFFKRHRWWTTLGLILAVLLVCVFVLLPPAVRWGIEAWLESHGRLEAQVEEVDFNLVSGNLVVHSLIAERGGAGGLQWIRAALEIAWQPILKKRIRFDDISLNKAQVTIVQEENGEVYVGGFRVVDGKEKTGPEDSEDGWEIGYGSIDLRQVTVIWKSPQFRRQFLIPQAHFDPLLPWEPASASDFTANIALESGSLQIQGSAKPYGKSISSKGQVQADQIPLQWAAPWIPDGTIQDIGGNLEADLHYSFSTGTKPEFSLDGELALHRLGGSMNGIEIQPLMLSWDGAFQMVFPQSEAGDRHFTADGVLAAREAAVELNSPNLALRSDSIRFQGEFTSNPEQVPEGAGFSFSGTAEAAGLSARQIGASNDLAQIEAISAKQLRIRGIEQIRIASGRLQQTKFLPVATSDKPASNQNSTFALGELILQNLHVEPDQKRLRIGAAEFDALQVQLIREKQGGFQDFDLPEFDTKDDANGAPWEFVVERAAIGQSSAVRFLDYSVEPTVDLELSRISASVENLNTASPGSLPVSFQAEMGQYSSIQMQGTLDPLGPNINMDINGEVKQFGLPEVRGYVRQNLGYTIKSGQLYADFHLNVDRGRMDSEIKLLIRQLNLEPVPAEAAEDIAAELGMPINTAIDLIRDRDEHIRIRLPVTGSLTQPDIALQDVIAKAIRNAGISAVKTAALSYFAPLGAAYAAGKLFGKVVALRLEPLIFDPGQEQLAEDHKTYLNRVAEKLGDRPKAQLLVCGQATTADRQELRQNQGERDKGQKDAAADISDARLRNLAENRAENTRAYLVAQGIASERLVLCAPELSTDEEDKPQVALAI